MKRTPRQDAAPTTLLRKAVVRSRVGMSDRTIERRIKDGTFPAPIRISPRIVAWIQKDVETWIRERAEAGR